MKGSKRLRELLAKPGIIVAPGAYDAMSAKLVEAAGFLAAYIGSYATAAARFALPDAGLVSLTEMTDHAASLVSAVERTPIIADAENGFGNAATVWRTVREFERTGVAGIHIEDHEFGKHLSVPGRVAAKDQMVEKIKAALDARVDPDFVIIARTDAGHISTCGGVEDAIDRALAYGAAGADMVFLAGVRAPALARVKHRIPYPICNTDSVDSTVAQDEASGAKLVLYYSLLLHAAYRSVRDVLAEFRKTADRKALVDRYLTEGAEFERFIGYGRIEKLALQHKVV